MPGSQDDLITPGDQEAAGTQVTTPADDRAPDVKRRAEGR